MDEGLTNDQLTQLLQTAVDAAHIAAVPIRNYFEKQDLRIREKSDGSPVTQADQEGEALIRVHLLSNATIGPLDILGEEEGLKGTGTRWQWIVDPIDGTRSFIHGIPLFGTLIALFDTQEHVPLVGVIHHPMLGLYGFAVDWMRKDLAYVLEEARSNGARLPVAALVDQFYAAVQAMGGGRWDTSSLLRPLEAHDTSDE
jgi:fructose-1,6-bisphosphatase/inositol monophosphatase family enzyme